MNERLNRYLERMLFFICGFLMVFSFGFSLFILVIGIWILNKNDGGF